MPVGLNMWLIKSWKPIIDKVENRHSKWKEKALSQGGRLILAKSVLGALPLYYLSLFRALSKVIHDLEALRRKFCWGHPKKKKYHG